MLVRWHEVQVAGPVVPRSRAEGRPRVVPGLCGRDGPEREEVRRGPDGVAPRHIAVGRAEGVRLARRPRDVSPVPRSPRSVSSGDAVWCPDSWRLYDVDTPTRERGSAPSRKQLPDPFHVTHRHYVLLTLGDRNPIETTFTERKQQL